MRRFSSLVLRQIRPALVIDIIYIYTGIFVFDICVVSLTLWKTLKIYKEGHFPGGVGIMILRDGESFLSDFSQFLKHSQTGLLYFAVITLFTLANMVTYLVSIRFLLE